MDNVVYLDGDLLTTKAEVLVHQINSLATKSHGISSAIKDKFPWADRYGERRSWNGRNLAIPEDQDRPGTIVKMYPPEGVVAPFIVGLVAQYDMSTPGRYNRGMPFSDQDTKEQRQSWFSSALFYLSDFVLDKRIRSVAFPEKIGCGLAGGDWSVYQKLILNFARVVPSTKVIIVSLLDETKVHKNKWRLECGTDGFYIYKRDGTLVAFVPAASGLDGAERILALGTFSNEEVPC